MLIAQKCVKSQQFILIGSAFKAEIVDLIEKLKSRQNRYHGFYLDYLTTGKGLSNVRRRLQAISASNRYFAIVNVGTAGAIGKTLPPLTVFCPERLCGLVNDQLSEIQAPGALHFAAQLPDNWKRGRLFSSTMAVTTPAARQKIMENYQADAVDMEAFAYADFCQHHKIPFFCQKIITDRADREAEASFRTNLTVSAHLLAENVPTLLDILLPKFELETENG